jgi:hypothetical protein
LVQAAAALRHEPYVDPAEARLIVREVIDKLIVAVRCGGFGTLRRNGTVGAMLREDAPSVVTYPARAAARKLRRRMNSSHSLEDG